MFREGVLHGKGIRYQENGIDILCKGKFIKGRFFDETLFSIRKFLETNDDSVLKNVTKQSILSYIQNSYHDDSISLKSTKSAIVSMLQHLYKKHELNKEKTVSNTEDLFGNPIMNPCLGNDGEIYDLVSMEYLFQKNQDGRYTNIPYCYNQNGESVPNYPRMTSGLCLSSYTLQG
jgi:hypothetical protein